MGLLRLIEWFLDEFGSKSKFHAVTRERRKLLAEAKAARLQAQPSVSGPKPEQLFTGVPALKESWRSEIEKRARADDARLPSNVVEITHILGYPMTAKDTPTYLATWEEPVCLLRIGHEWDDAVFKELCQAAQSGHLALNLKAYGYPTYPIFQFVLSIHPPSRSKPWWKETIGDICDGDIQGFIQEFCRLRRWKLILARYDPLREKQKSGMIDSITITVSPSPSQVTKFLTEANTATAHFVGIAASRRSFKDAVDKFTRDSLPIEGVA